MGHTRKRPITGTTPTGVGIKYIIVEAGHVDDTSIRVIANGTVTFTVDSTYENILYDATAKAAINIGNPNERYVAPTDAVWKNEIASGSVTATTLLQSEPIFAIRINITAGTGSVTYTILQA